MKKINWLFWFTALVLTFGIATAIFLVAFVLLLIGQLMVVIGNSFGELFDWNIRVSLTCMANIKRKFWY